MQSSSRSSSPARKDSITSNGGSNEVQSSITESSSASSNNLRNQESQYIPTELFKRAANGALKASRNLLKFNQPSIDALKRISASSTYSFQERRSIDSAVSSLMGGGVRRGSSASTSSIPTFNRSSHLKILLSDATNHTRPFSPLNRIMEEEEEENETGSLKRALSWPRRNPVSSMTSFLGSAVADATLSGYEAAESFDSAIFSIFILKKNRRGQFQKRYFIFLKFETVNVVV